MKKVFGFCVCLSLVLALILPALAAETARQRLESGINKIVGVMSDPLYKNVQPRPEAMKEKFRAVIHGFFDFRELSRWALGKPWNKFSPEEREKFVAMFTDLLENTYLEKILSYTDEMKVEYDKELVQKENYVQIDTRLMAKAGPIPISYSMKRMDDGNWMVYDVNAEGVSLVKNYRTQFGEILDTSTPEKFETTKAEMFKRLAQKIKDVREHKKID